ncbi:MAG: hypothetical protein US42_C0003G0006 [Candidatus Magasanikbacteria bacterium GW2011_GWC2_37_14]|uniref:Uncharacterized protein n=1 Tax=Candidatus Magasanikbacteria bacterium GW2011_GWC2_37_14 TaxID=1619046 RepID=A0A0G0IUV8_9BACT|nr:MAG: hypothetical protein US42_C0003G0006 [Candidatus Magasanikbacteria bacterium GW2011_GWC2_37_14]
MGGSDATSRDRRSGNHGMPLPVGGGHLLEALPDGCARSPQGRLHDHQGSGLRGVRDLQRHVRAHGHSRVGPDRPDRHGHEARRARHQRWRYRLLRHARGLDGSGVWRIGHRGVRGWREGHRLPRPTKWHGHAHGGRHHRQELGSVLRVPPRGDGGGLLHAQVPGLQRRVPERHQQDRRACADDRDALPPGQPQPLRPTAQRGRHGRAGQEVPLDHRSAPAPAGNLHVHRRRRRSHLRQRGEGHRDLQAYRTTARVDQGRGCVQRVLRRRSGQRQPDEPAGHPERPSGGRTGLCHGRSTAPGHRRRRNPRRLRGPADDHHGRDELCPHGPHRQPHRRRCDGRHPPARRRGQAREGPGTRQSLRRAHLRRPLRRR